MLLLQALQFCTTTDYTPSTLIPPQKINKELLLGEQVAGKTDGVSKSDDVPEFDTGLTDHIKSGYEPNDESGYESSDEINKETGVDDKFGHDAGYKSDPKLDKNNKIIDIENLIQSMREAADEKRGIKWSLSGDELIRSVVHNSGNRNLYTGEDYVVIGLSIYRAAVVICALHNMCTNRLVNSAHGLMAHYYNFNEEKSEECWIKTIKHINGDIVLYLRNNIFPNKSFDWINQKLRLAESYAGLDDTHYNVTTTFTIRCKKFALEDKKWLTLTAKQKESYINRKSEKWYNRLEPFEQKFIDRYWSKIADGKHYIPTQLRNIPGCRNAYEKRVLAYDENNNPIVLGRYYHSGSLVSPIEWADKETDFQITKDNWEQINQHIKNPIIISLNYNMDLPYFKQCQEKKIVTDTEKVVGSDQFMNLSINGIGTSRNLKNQFDKLVKNTIAYYEKKHPELCKYLNKESTNRGFFKQKFNKEKNINKQIEKIKDQKDKIYFKLLVELMEAANSSQILNNLKQSVYIRDNPNANICSSFIACMAMLSTATPTPPVVFNCKSGKDRTGKASTDSDEKIIKTHCRKSEESEENNNIHKYLAYTGHYQFLASVNGGMPGRFGMKSVKGNQQIADFSHLLFRLPAELTQINEVKNPKVPSDITSYTYTQELFPKTPKFTNIESVKNANKLYEKAR